VTRRGVPAALRAGLVRLRGRPDSEHEMGFNRVVFGPAVLLYVLLASPEQGGVAMLAAYIAISILVLVAMVFDPGERPARRVALMVLDLVTLSVVLHENDAIGAGLFPLYLWIIFGNGFRFGIPYLMAAAGVGIVTFTVVIMTTPVWLNNVSLAHGLLAGLLLLPAYSGHADPQAVAGDAGGGGGEPRQELFPGERQP
jgi:two-component system sensor histidine kinase RpfC